MKNIFQVKTGIQVPLHLMYLDLGQVPARYQVQRFKLNYLQYILQQKETSLLHKMLMAQQEHPVRNDWLSGVHGILIDWNIDLGLDEIRCMKRNQFKNITKTKAEESALAYLLQRNTSGSKGSNLRYGAVLEMAEYLCPNNFLSVEDQREIFQIRSQTNALPANRGDPQPCLTGCGGILNNPHVFQCPIINKENIEDYDLLVNGTLNEMKNSLSHWKENLKKINSIDSTDSVYNC